MMMLSSGAATDKAEATKIVSDMRNLKSAALMYYSDNNAWPVTVEFSGAASSYDKYLDNKPAAGLGYVNEDGGNTVAVVCNTANYTKNKHIHTQYTMSHKVEEVRLGSIEKSFRFFVI